MNSGTTIVDMENFFMALADRTRLRLLNLLRDGEVCVYFFTEVMGDSQPKVSRHLAYLRNAGIVTARRDGKWVHYSISRSLRGGRGVLDELFAWMDGREELRFDRERYREVCGSAAALGQDAATQLGVILPQAHILEERFEYAAAHNELEEFLL